MALPYRSNVFDAAVSIAVLHHVTSVPRRRSAKARTLRAHPLGEAALSVRAGDGARSCGGAGGS